MHKQHCLQLTQYFGFRSILLFAALVGALFPHSTEANQNPQVSSRPVNKGHVGTPYEYQVVANDPDGDTLTYTLTSAPQGMVISAKGRITWLKPKRADGMFDLAVNGGGALIVKYVKTNFLSAQRQVQVPWQDFVRAPDVILVAQDTHVTTVDLTSNAVMQVARSTVITDTEGTRQATLLFPQGTQAQVVMPNGSSTPLPTLSVRATDRPAGAVG